MQASRRGMHCMSIFVLLIQLDPGLVADVQQGAGLPLSCRPIGNLSPWMGQDRRSRRAKVESRIAPGEK